MHRDLKPDNILIREDAKHTKNDIECVISGKFFFNI